jgi:hypothetical protein
MQAEVIAIVAAKIKTEVFLKFILKLFVITPIVLGLLLVWSFTGFYIPLPYPRFLVSADEAKLIRPSCFRLNGKLYVVGGYRTKKVPTGFRFMSVNWAFGNSEEAGLEYHDKNVMNMRMYEITDTKEAFVVDNLIKQSKHYTFNVNPHSWKDLGKIGSWKIIRESEYFLEFKGSIYAIGGTGYNAEKDQDIQHADVWMSSDLVTWKQIAGKVPWSSMKSGRRKHQLTVVDNAIYLVGGSGRSSNGEDKHVTYGDVWKSEDGITWEETENRPPQPDNQVLELNAGFYHIEEQSTLYTSKDGKNWQRLLDTEHTLEIIDNKLAMIITPNYQRGDNRHDLYLSTDGLKWTHSKTNEIISFTPKVVEEDENIEIAGYRLGAFHADGDYERYSGFNLVEFNNALWLIGKSPDYLFRADDGLSWKNLELAKGGKFPPRSGAAIGAYNGYIWIMGGSWLDTVALGDIWRSRDGINWELVTSDAPWGTIRLGSMFAAKGRLYLAKEGVEWDRQLGVVAHPLEIWSTTDGVVWRKETDNANNIIIQTCNMENIDRVVETSKALYFLDDQYHQRFLREPRSDAIQGTFLLGKFRPNTCTEVRSKGKNPVFVSIEHNEGFLTSDNLIQWENCYLKPKTEQAGRGIGMNFLTSGDSGIRYKPIMFKNRLFAVGVDFMTKKVYSAALLLDAPNNTITGNRQ